MVLKRGSQLFKDLFCFFPYPVSKYGDYLYTGVLNTIYLNILLKYLIQIIYVL